jgi:DNA-binding NarL/FixJ family response regulator
VSASSPSVVIADDHPAIRLGVRMALMRDGMCVLAEAADRDGAVTAVVRERPDVCLLDIQMPGGGIETAATLAAVAPQTAVVMLTVSTSTAHLLAALRAGAVGYLPKDTPPDRLPAALRGVLAGEPALPRAFVGPVLGELRGPAYGADWRSVGRVADHRAPARLDGNGQAGCSRPYRGRARPQRLDNPHAHRVHGGLQAAAYAELVEDVAYVLLDGVRTD